MSERFSIAQVTPYPWEQHHEVNGFVERLSDELCARGHRVVVVAPSDSRELIRESRAVIDRAAGDSDATIGRAAGDPDATIGRAAGDPDQVSGRAAGDPDAVFAEEGCARVLGVGQSLPLARGARSGAASLPLDVSRTIEGLLELARFDFVHVHEPFAPSAASAALRHSRALNVGTFHAATERILSTQVARRLVQLHFGRLDGRTASFAATRDLMARFFPGAYRVVPPGVDILDGGSTGVGGELEIVYSAGEERSALRLFLRALRRLPAELPWRATVWSPLGEAPAAPLARALRDRVRFAGPRDGSEAQHLARAQIAVAASSGTSPAPQLLLRALGVGAVPVASRLPQYEEALADGERGLLFEPRDSYTLAAQLERLITDRALREDLRHRACAAREELSWTRTVDRFEDLYADIANRRHRPRMDAGLARRLAERPYVHVDLHMHTDHSPDCATPVDTLLATAVERGLGAIAVTDHNEISGALEARARTPDGLQVIVAEEVKTADQGEVIGLFIEEKIPRGMTLDETIAAIRRQGGLIYVPHPFDRMHSVPDYEHLLEIIEDIDAIEVFNPRVAFSAFNEEAVRFAAKYRITAAAGSDSHVAQGLGSVKIRMRDFRGPEEFLASLRDADIIRKRQSLLYVQALKFFQTKARTGRQAPSEEAGAP